MNAIDKNIPLINLHPFQLALEEHLITQISQYVSAETIEITTPKTIKIGTLLLGIRNDVYIYKEAAINTPVMMPTTQ